MAESTEKKEKESKSDDSPLGAAILPRPPPDLLQRKKYSYFEERSCVVMDCDWLVPESDAPRSNKKHRKRGDQGEEQECKGYHERAWATPSKIKFLLVGYGDNPDLCFFRESLHKMRIILNDVPFLDGSGQFAQNVTCVVKIEFSAITGVHSAGLEIREGLKEFVRLVKANLNSNLDVVNYNCLCFPSGSKHSFEVDWVDISPSFCARMSAWFAVYKKGDLDAIGSMEFVLDHILSGFCVPCFTQGVKELAENIKSAEER